MAARTSRRFPHAQPAGPVDFRHLHWMHMKASHERDELLEEARVLQAAGKVRDARAALAKAEGIHESLKAFESQVRFPGAHRRDKRWTDD